ncbi:dihydropteroate synthase [Spirochaetota bacterium]|nr:dihydropteroate synthase [Spirochaetota bacterium]
MQLKQVNNDRRKNSSDSNIPADKTEDKKWAAADTINESSPVKADFSLKIALRDGKSIMLSRPYIMGILNVTPDSFFDGGLFSSDKAFFKKVNEMLLFGVDFIDLGGESSRPGAKPVSIAEERRRVIPKLKRLKKKYPHIIVSVDTRNEPIASEAIDCGADIINDISAGDDSNGAMLKLVAKTQTPIILMHKKGQPQTMQQNVAYDNVESEVFSYLEHKIALLKELALSEDKIIIDVGIGFGKEHHHNITLIKNLDKFKALGHPILIGASMKSLITHLTGCDPSERLAGTLGVHLAAIVHGANIIRVHDVKSARYSLAGFLPMLGDYG